MGQALVCSDLRSNQFPQRVSHRASWPRSLDAPSSVGSLEWQLPPTPSPHLPPPTPALGSALRKVSRSLAQPRGRSCTETSSTSWDFSQARACGERSWGRGQTTQLGLSRKYLLDTTARLLLGLSWSATQSHSPTHML